MTPLPAGVGDVRSRAGGNDCGAAEDQPLALAEQRLAGLELDPAGVGRAVVVVDEDRVARLVGIADAPFTAARVWNGSASVPLNGAVVFESSTNQITPSRAMFAVAVEVLPLSSTIV